MSKRPTSKAFIEDTSSSSDSEEEDKEEKEKAKKKAKKEEKKAKAEESKPTEWQLSNNRKVTISNFKGKILVDIREYYQGPDGEPRPGKRGISLSIDQWKKLKESMDGIDEALREK